jgi:S-formylglutathione hydrolase FrmB
MSLLGRIVLALALYVGSGALGDSSSPGASAAGTLRGRILYSSFHSSALRGTVHYSVYLPPGYERSRKRYPVVYFLHGLPADATSYRDIDRVAAAVERSGHPAIVVGAQGARAGDTDPEWRDWGPSRNWETATVTELVGVVDRRYRTIATRSGRLLVGVSAGGYGATLIALHNPGVFGVVESWSGYFHATTPDGSASLDLGSRDADEWANAYKLVSRVKRFLRWTGGRSYLAFYVGDADALFRDENVAYASELRAAGVDRAVFRLYSGGHDWNLWASHATAWLSRGLAIAAPAA